MMMDERYNVIEEGGGEWDCGGGGRGRGKG